MKWHSRRTMGLALAMVWIVQGSAARADYVLDRAGPWNLTPSLEYAEETEPGVPPPDDAYHAINRNSLALGILSGAYWFRVHVRNDSDVTHFSLVIDNPRLGLVELWLPDDNGMRPVARVGDTEAPTAGVLSRRPAAFRVRLATGSAETLYFKIQHHGSLLFETWLWPSRVYLQYRALADVLFGALCGAIAIMFLYHLLLTLQVRQFGYLYFTLFILFYLFYILSLTGLGNDYVWPGRVWLADRGIICFLGWSSFFLHAFSRAFLGTRKRAPGWDRCIVTGMVLSAVVGIGALWQSLAISYLAHGLVIATSVYIVGASLACLYRGYRPAGLFVFAWGTLMLCAGGMSMASLGWIPRNGYVEVAAHGGFVVALALFSVAMEARKRLSVSRYRAELEQQVRERTSELQQALDNVQTLSGIIPICSHCKKIRDDAGYWNQVEAYLNRLGDISLTHGVCPDCAVKHYPEFERGKP